MVNAVVLVATGVNGDGHREVLGVKVATSRSASSCSKVRFADHEASAPTFVPSTASSLKFTNFRINPPEQTEAAAQ